MSESASTAAVGWDALAVEAEEWAAYEETRDVKNGTNTGSVHTAKVWRNRAETYRRAAEALRLEVMTGKPHCTCCLKPMGAHDRFGRSV